jgi:RNA polymerase sigma-70 factor (ECF subfamily)
VAFVESRLKLLMVAGLAGSPTAYRQLLEASARRLRRYFARRVGADCADLEDLVQETLIAIHRRRTSYDQSLPYTAWLHAIARYKLIDHLRRRGVGNAVPLDEAEAIAAADDSAACLAAIDVERLLAELPEKHRFSIRLTRLDGYSSLEAADLTGRTASAVKIDVHRGMKRLMAKVNGEHADD